MRMKPLLAIAALSLALSACTAPPQASGTGGSQEARGSGLAPGVALEVQGLARGTITASTLTLNAEHAFLMEGPSFERMVGHFDAHDAATPSGAVDVTRVAPVGPETFPYMFHPSGDNMLYRFVPLRAQDMAMVRAHFVKDDRSTVEATIKRLPGGAVVFVNPQPEGFSGWRNYPPVLKFASEAPATLRYIPSITMPRGAIAYAVDNQLNGRDFEMGLRNVHRLDLTFTLTTMSGQPLLGITQDFLHVAHLSTFTAAGPDSEREVSEDDRILSLTELGEGRYKLTFDLYADVNASAPASVKVELELRNAPLIRDVEY